LSAAVFGEESSCQPLKRYVATGGGLSGADGRAKERGKEKIPCIRKV